MNDIRNIFEESRRYLESGSVESVSGYLGVRGE
jgi:hypothetical protein